MEPARNGRDDRVPVLACRGGGHAAMEPARNGRDDGAWRRLPGRGDRAAMEPARNGRDDDLTARRACARPRVPQWSPPVMGGMTAPVRQRDPVRQVAAMEPARNGRDDGW